MEKIISVYICLFLIDLSHAALFTVDNDGPADFNNIQSALNAADDGDIIIVQPGLYEGNINFLGKNIVLISTTPTNLEFPAATVINGLVVFRGTEDSNCILAGFKISGNGGIAGFDHSIDPNGENHTRATISHCLLQGILTRCGTVIAACDGIINNCLVADNINLCYCIRPAINECHGLIKNCSIYSGWAVGIGEGGSTTIQNCIILSNSEYRQPIRVDRGGTVSIVYSDVEGGLEGVYVEDSNNLVNWGLGNIDEDPCFVKLGYLEMVDSNLVIHLGDYHLQSAAGRWNPNINDWVIDANTSTCIDTGNPGCPVGSEPLPNGNRINMGAYGGTPTTSKSPIDWHNIADITNDDAVNSHDLAAFVSFWLSSGFEQPADINRNGKVDFTDFVILADNWLWQK